MVKSDRSKLVVAMVTAVIATSVVVTGFCLTGSCSSNANRMDNNSSTANAPSTFQVQFTLRPTARTSVAPATTAPPSNTPWTLLSTEPSIAPFTAPTSTAPTSTAPTSTAPTSTAPTIVAVLSNPPTLHPTQPAASEAATTSVPTAGPTNNPAVLSTATAAFRAFESTRDLYAAVDEYVTAIDSATTAAATMYGHPIGSWDVSRITVFDRLFDGAMGVTAHGRNSQNLTVANAMRSFNEDLSHWNVSQAISMRLMFQHTSTFNGDISSWDVAQVTHMDFMFAWAVSFNGDISSWDVGRVSSMWYTFLEADVFNGDISNWNVGRVTNMWGMLQGADAFNRNISGWDVGQVTTMWGMLQGADAFSQNICEWRTTASPRALRCVKHVLQHVLLPRRRHPNAPEWRQHVPKLP